MEGNTYTLTHIDFSFPDAYDIEDSEQTVVYRARAQALSFGKAFELADRLQAPQIEIHNRVIANKTTYDFKRNGEVVSKVVQPFQRFTRLEAEGSAGKFILESYADYRPSPRSGSQSGNQTSGWKVTDGDMTELAEVRREDVYTARYRVIVAPAADAPLMLAFAIVLSEILGFGPAVV